MEGMEICCEVCGNEVETEIGNRRCPFCWAELAFSPTGRGTPHKLVNLKKGMPSVDQALTRLDRELDQAGQEHYRVLTLIHGYGSTGQGGAIREEVRARLLYLKYKGDINDVVVGEDFSFGTGTGRNLLRRFSFLRQHTDLNRKNPGVTLVVM